MSTTTPYLGLVLYDSTTDQAVTFATFRAVWGGPASTSNFYKIDTGMSGFNTRITNLENASGAVPVPALFSSSNFYVATGVTGITSYTVGDLIILSLDTTSSGTVTLNINSLGTKSVMKVDSTGTAINLTGSDLVKNRQYLFMYDGTRWTWVSANSADQIQIVGTSGNVVTVGSTNNLLGTTTQAGLIADTTHAATTKTTPADADEIGWIDSAASYVLKRLTYSSLKLALWAGIKPPNGKVWNGKIVPSVTSNNLTLAMKTLAGSDASATDPIYVTIGDTVRQITAALSVTKNAATNWFNSGAETATLEVDYFAYLGYNATDGVVIGFSRIPYASLYSDFSATTTNDRYCAISTITNAAAGDNYVNIGRFAAILSAGGGYTWSVPTFNSGNLITYPVFTTRRLDWIPTFTGFSANPTGVHSYTIAFRKLFLDIRHSTNGTSNAATFYMTMAITPLTLSNAKWAGVGQYLDNGTVGATPALCSISSGTATITSTKSWVGTDDWTTSGSKRMASMSMNCDI